MNAIFRKFSMIAAIAALLAPAFATSVVPIPLPELSRRASTVVEGRALESSAAWNPQHTLIFTYTKFQVLKTLKGEPQRIVVVRQLGGHAGGYTQSVAGVAPFFPGQESVLFLRPSSANDGSLEVVGLMQGAFAIEHASSGEAFISNHASGVKTYSATTAAETSEEFTGTTMRLSDFEALVRRAVSK